MRTIELDLPEDVGLDDQELKMILLTQIYDRGLISSGKAADLAGIGRRDFIEKLEDYGVCLNSFKMSVEEFQEEMNGVRDHRRRRKLSDRVG